MARTPHGKRYGTVHQTTRRRWKQRLAKAESLPCARCGWPVYATWPLNPPKEHVPKCTGGKPYAPCEGTCWTTWDLGHTDDGTAYQGVEHSCCNRSAGAVNSNKPKRGATPAAKSVTKRDTVGNDYGW